MHRQMQYIPLVTQKLAKTANSSSSIARHVRERHEIDRCLLWHRVEDVHIAATLYKFEHHLVDALQVEAAGDGALHALLLHMLLLALLAGHLTGFVALWSCERATVAKETTYSW